MKDYTALLLAAIFLVGLSGVTLRAQSLSGPGYINLQGGTSPNAVPNNFIGPLFLWDPGKAALRFGKYYAEDGAISPECIGPESFAFGGAAIASGIGTFAIGTSYAVGNWSMALGAEAYAMGPGSIAIMRGYTTQTGVESIAIGNATANGESSIAMGSTEVSSSGGFAVGLWNLNKKKDGITTPNPNVPSADDPVVELAAGGYDVRKSALTVYRDGTIKIDGPVRLTTAQGGVSMGAFQ